MEDFTNATPLDTGPFYFFDQWKPKRKTWTKRTCDNQFSHLKYMSEDEFGPIEETKPKELKKARLPKVAESDKEDEFPVPSVSQSPSVPKLPPKQKFSKIQLTKNLFEEYKLTAPEILYELGETLQKYTKCNITFPVGIVNLMNYTWEDLTEGAHRYVSKDSTLEQDSASQGDSNFMTSVDVIEPQISSCSRKIGHKENHSVKAKKDHDIASSKSMEKTLLVKQNQSSENFEDSSSLDVIHFSLSSKICLENDKFTLPTEVNSDKQPEEKDWIFQHPYSKLEILKWKTLLSTAVKRLQVAIIQIKIIAMMFNQDGGMVISKKGNILREWMWPSKGKLDDPVEIWVNRFITVKISGRFAITLVYKWHPQSLKLSLAPVKCKPYLPCLPEVSCADTNPNSREARDLFKAYKMKCKQLRFTTQNTDPSSLADSVDTDTFDPSMDISPLHDIITAIKLRRLQRKVKHIFFDWLNHYRFTLGMESLHICKTPVFFPQKVVRKQEVSSAKLSVKQGTKEKDEEKEYLRYRNTFLELKGVFKPLPLRGNRRTPAGHQSLR
ncbi:uncharacterized protein LOC128580885 [Nycticebus coucang]|uniref:uncharacterized protein LOC128580885 n=1 Tax=Nycticebus coucang TaxID=9470 RepID=UPI00234D4297|nr:uncharacterized protein LOC128580885 [Nycticebus coucang]